MLHSEGMQTLTIGTLVSITAGKYAGQTATVREGSKGGKMLTLAGWRKAPYGFGMRMFKVGTHNVVEVSGPVPSFEIGRG